MPNFEVKEKSIHRLGREGEEENTTKGHRKKSVTESRALRLQLRYNAREEMQNASDAIPKGAFAPTTPPEIAANSKLA
jgi:hypothetical protein